jgi:hypothetical protein
MDFTSDLASLDQNYSYLHNTNPKPKTQKAKTSSCAKKEIENELPF